MKIDHCEFPDELLYDVELGTWGRLRDETLRVGLTSLLSWSFGTFSAITFKGVGTEVSRGRVMGSVEGSGHFDVVRSPVSGTISRINALLAARPELLNRDPYGKGWFAEIKVGKTEDLGSLQRLPDAEPLIARELRERHVHCFAAFPDYEMSDIGVECAAVIVELNELLSNSSTGTVVHVISDDSSAEVEMERWSDQTGNALLEYRKDGNMHHFIVRKTG